MESNFIENLALKRIDPWGIMVDDLLASSSSHYNAAEISKYGYEGQL